MLLLNYSLVEMQDRHHHIIFLTRFSLNEGKRAGDYGGGNREERERRGMKHKKNLFLNL